jgi:hypothetical protein
MRGLWIWSEDAKEQDRVIGELRQEGHLASILKTLQSAGKGGLSNAEIDLALTSYSQWGTLWHLRELTALRFIEYKVALFGEPARYSLTELGTQVAARI